MFTGKHQGAELDFPDRKASTLEHLLRQFSSTHPMARINVVVETPRIVKERKQTDHGGISISTSGKIQPIALDPLPVRKAMDSVHPRRNPFDHIINERIRNLWMNEAQFSLPLKACHPIRSATLCQAHVKADPRLT